MCLSNELQQLCTLKLSIAAMHTWLFCQYWEAYRAAMAHRHAARERREDALCSGGDWGDQEEGERSRATYLEYVRSSASQMRRPAVDKPLTWRSVSSSLSLSACLLARSGQGSCCSPNGRLPTLELVLPLERLVVVATWIEIS